MFKPWLTTDMMQLVFRTDLGSSYVGDSEQVLKCKQFSSYIHRVNLIFTSPPFPLIRKKSYGNLNGESYVNWLSQFGPIFNDLLAPDGSLVIELGNAWNRGSPTMSLTPIKSLIALKEKGKFNLCQEFIWHNTGKLPSPAQWVNVKRVRVKDAFTRLWWLAPTANPKANNREVLTEYSNSMKRLLKRKKYNSGRRPSQHTIGEESFLKNNNGAIPSNVFSIANTTSVDPYLDYCRKERVSTRHPCRMPIDLAKFFVLFLTDENDLILDPFAGTNVTGYVAETNKRRWLSIEKNREYATSATSRFEKGEVSL